jgi:hypothetical protein
MIPRTIHLIWYGEQEKESLDAAAYWRANGQGRVVVVHTDPSYLRESWRENYEKHAHNYANQSDWLRWSLMLDCGGWYFDTDVRPKSAPDLDKIEISMENTCCIVPAIIGMGCLEADILCCAPGWPGERIVDEYMRQKRDEVVYLQYSIVLVGNLQRQYPDWFTIADAKLFRTETKEARLRRAKRTIATPCVRGAKHGSVISPATS